METKKIQYDRELMIKVIEFLAYLAEKQIAYRAVDLFVAIYNVMDIPPLGNAVYPFDEGKDPEWCTSCPSGVPTAEYQPLVQSIFPNAHHAEDVPSLIIIPEADLFRLIVSEGGAEREGAEVTE